MTFWQKNKWKILAPVLIVLVLAVAFVGLFKYKHERVAPGAQPVVH